MVVVDDYKLQEYSGEDFRLLTHQNEENIQDTLDVKEQDMLKRKNKIAIMLSEINKLDLTKDEIAMNDEDECLGDIIPQKEK